MGVGYSETSDLDLDGKKLEIWIFRMGGGGILKLRIWT